MDPLDTRTVQVSEFVGTPPQRGIGEFFAGKPFVFEPSGLKFSAPAAITLFYGGIQSRRVDAVYGIDYDLMVFKMVPDGMSNDGRPTASRYRWKPVAPSQKYTTADGVNVVTCLVTGFSTLVPMAITAHPSCTSDPLSADCASRFPWPRESSAGMEVYTALACAVFLWFLLPLVLAAPTFCKGMEYVDPEDEPEEEVKQVAIPLPVSPPPPPAPIVFVRETEPERRFNDNGSLIRHYGDPIHRREAGGDSNA